MSVTVRENILESIKTILEGVIKANGYDNNIASVQRWQQRGNIFREVPWVMIAAGPEDKKPGPDPLTTCNLTVSLMVGIRQDENDSTVTDTLLNSLLGDIEKAITVDYTCGGYAQDSNIRNVVSFEAVEGEPHAGLIIELEIIYRHIRTDPKTAG